MDATVGSNRVRLVISTSSGRVFTSIWDTVSDEEYDEIRRRVRGVLSGGGQDDTYNPHPTVYDITVTGGHSVFIPSRNIDTITMEDGDDFLDD